MGILGSFGMILGTQKVYKKNFSQKIAGYIMASHLVFGLGFGSNLGWLLGSIVKNSKESFLVSEAFITA